MESIEEIPEKSNSWPKTYHNRLLIGSSMLMIAIAAFGLGRLSFLTDNTAPVTILPLASANEAFTKEEMPEKPIPASVKNYVAARGGTAYYLPSCSGANRIKDANKIWFSTKQEAEKLGFKAAASCKGI